MLLRLFYNCLGIAMPTGIFYKIKYLADKIPNLTLLALKDTLNTVWFLRKKFYNKQKGKELAFQEEKQRRSILHFEQAFLLDEGLMRFSICGLAHI